MGFTRPARRFLEWRRFGDDRPYHYLGSPWFFAQAGTAFAEAMKGLIKR